MLEALLFLDTTLGFWGTMVEDMIVKQNGDQNFTCCGSQWTYKLTLTATNPQGTHTFNVIPHKKDDEREPLRSGLFSSFGIYKRSLSFVVVSVLGI